MFYNVCISIHCPSCHYLMDEPLAVWTRPYQICTPGPFSPTIFNILNQYLFTLRLWDFEEDIIWNRQTHFFFLNKKLRDVPIYILIPSGSFIRANLQLWIDTLLVRILSIFILTFKDNRKFNLCHLVCIDNSWHFCSSNLL